MFTNSQLTVRFYADAVRRRWWLVAAVALVVTGVGAVAAFTTDAEYRSTVTLRVHAGADAGGDTEASDASVPAGSTDRLMFDVVTQVRIIESADLRSEVQDALGADTSFGRVTVGTEGFSPVITIAVAAASPTAARDAAATYAELYLDRHRAEVVAPLREQVAELEDERQAVLEELAEVDARLADPATETFRLDTLRLERESLNAEEHALGRRIDELEIEAEQREAQISVVSEASLPPGPVPRGRGRDVATALALGLGIGLVAAVVVELARDRVVDPADLAALDPDVGVFDLGTASATEVVDELRALGVGEDDVVGVLALGAGAVPPVLLDGLEANFAGVSVDRRDVADTTPVRAAALQAVGGAIVLVVTGTTRRSAVRTVYRALRRHDVEHLAVSVPPERA